MDRECFGDKTAFSTPCLVNDKLIISTQYHTAREVVIQPLKVGAFAVRITNHKIFHILQLFTVTGREIACMQGI